MRRALRWAFLGGCVVVGAYATYVGSAWRRFGRARRAPGREDPLLDRFMPTFDVVEHHHMHVDAPAMITLRAACEADLQRSVVVRAIFTAREALLGSQRDPTVRPTGLIALMKSLGWGVLAEVPDREIVMGAITRPWEANVVFRSASPDAFAAFAEPGYVKIAWTIRADPAGAMMSALSTQTRAVATDVTAHATFRRYWSFLSPGIIVIRRMMLRAIKAEAERRVPRQPSGDN